MHDNSELDELDVALYKVIYCEKIEDRCYLLTLVSSENSEMYSITFDSFVKNGTWLHLRSVFVKPLQKVH